MSNFIKESTEELEHVVWPTPAESKKYMLYTVGVIIVMASMLAVLGYALRSGMQWVRAAFPHTEAVTTTVSGEDLATQEDLKAIEALAEKRKAAKSGSTLSTASGMMVTGSGK